MALNSIGAGQDEDELNIVVLIIGLLCTLGVNAPSPGRVLSNVGAVPKSVGLVPFCPPGVVPSARFVDPVCVPVPEYVTLPAASL